MPSSPCKIIGLRPAGHHILEQWWALAKRHVFRMWPHLINNHTGIFLVTKCVKTHRFVQSCSKGTQGQASHVHIHGTTRIPRGNDDIELSINGTSWQIGRNDLGFALHEAGGNSEY